MLQLVTPSSCRRKFGPKWPFSNDSTVLIQKELLGELNEHDWLKSWQMVVRALFTWIIKMVTDLHG